MHFFLFLCINKAHREIHKHLLSFKYQLPNPPFPRIFTQWKIMTVSGAGTLLPVSISNIPKLEDQEANTYACTEQIFDKNLLNLGKLSGSVG